MNTDLKNSIYLLGPTITYRRNSEIFGESEAADYFYKVISGSVRAYKTLSDGRRQIGGFYIPGDVFGLEFTEYHAFSAEAIRDTKLIILKRATMNALAGSNVSIPQQLLTLASTELRRAHNHALLLIKSAQERMAEFLLEMVERAAEGNIIELPMMRQDIADYLGLSIETVSRILRSLEAATAIKILTYRRILLQNPAALRSLTSH